VGSGEFCGEFIIDGGEFLAVTAPGGVELDHEEGELLEDCGEVGLGEGEDSVFLGVGGCENEQSQKTQNLYHGNLNNMRQTCIDGL
jgi:hypothetical protein